MASHSVICRGVSITEGIGNLGNFRYFGDDVSPVYLENGRHDQILLENDYLL